MSQTVIQFRTKVDFLPISQASRDEYNRRAPAHRRREAMERRLRRVCAAIRTAGKLLTEMAP